MSPLPGHRALPAGWSAHHQRAAESVLTAAVAITRSDAAPGNDRDGWSRTKGKASAAPDAAVWAGPARIQALPSSAVTGRDAAGQAIARHVYLVQIPRTAAPLLAADDDGDCITVTAAPGDPGLVGRRLRVVEVTYASESWLRDVLCTDQLGENNPPRPAPTGGS